MRKYRKRQLEAMLSRAVAKQTPDLLAALQKAPIGGSAPPIPLPLAAARQAKRRWAQAAAALCACLLLCMGGGTLAYFHADAVVGIDVNPSIEIVTNRFDRVLAARAKNADAAAVLEGLELRHVDVDTAVNAVIGSMVRRQYLTAETNAVLVTVSGTGEKRRLQLEQRIVQDIESASGQLRIAVYVQDGAQGAPPADTPPASPGISAGKQRLIDRLLAADPSLDRAALAAMPIKELAALADELDIDLDDDNDGDDDDEDEDDDEDGKGDAGQKSPVRHTDGGKGANATAGHSRDDGRDYDDRDDDDDDRDDDDDDRDDRDDDGDHDRDDDDQDGDDDHDRDDG
ncbi:hypothetical protein LI291_09280 [Intestinibacillus massiliensis]|nr:hypothetical protein [Intestinibacillus massiliensis]